MTIRNYNDRQVSIERMWTYGGDEYLDLRDVQSGEWYRGVPADELDKPKGVAVVFEKDDETTILVKDSIDYQYFLKDHELKEQFIENCLKGISKTHKGFYIHYK